MPLREFFKRLFSYQVRDTMLLGIKTYYDKKCEFLQCPEGKYRSIDDIHECVKTYFPKATIEETITNLCVANLQDGFFPLFVSCDKIDKMTFAYYFHIDDWDDIPKLKRKSEWSWMELLEKIGITSEESYLEFIENYEEN